MTPSELLAAFETLAEAPDGVARLRELVLSLAVRGKLVAQDPGEEPSRPLVLAARQHLAANADEIRRGSWNMTSEVGESECPFNLPSGWAWARVNDTGFYINGLAFKPSHWKNSGRPIIRIQNLSDPSKPFNYAEGEFPDDVVVRKGDILVSWSATLEAFIWDREEGVLNQHIFRVKPAEILVSRPFLYYLLRQAIRDMADSKHAHGLVMAHINRGPFLNHVVAIPPLAEQHRIVARVDELMGLLDRLEAVRNRRDEVRRAARDAALAALRDAPDAEAVEAAWTRIAGEMHALFAHPEDVAPLRQAVLHLGVSGRLAFSSTSSYASGGASLPDGWRWSTVAEVGEVKLGRQRSPKDHTGDHMVPYLRVANVQDGYLDLTDVKEMNFTPEEQQVFRLEVGDVLLNEGQSRELVGRPAIYRGEISGCCFQNTLIRFRCGPDVYREFALLVFRSYLHSGRFQAAATQTTNIAHLSVARLKPVEFPLPSLAEQHHIVAKVEALMAICDALDARLTNARSLHSQAAAAAVHHLDV